MEIPPLNSGKQPIKEGKWPEIEIKEERARI